MKPDEAESAKLQVEVTHTHTHAQIVDFSILGCDSIYHGSTGNNYMMIIFCTTATH